jgi:small conductance mechanosensitive channel
VCWGLSKLFLSTVPLLETAVIGISWVLATGVPVYRVSVISYKLDMGLKGAIFWKKIKDVASPFITLWVSYLLLLEVCVLFTMISLALVFPTMAGFGGEISGSTFDLKSDLLRLFIKGLHYFYVTNFILFLTSLQQFLNRKNRKEKHLEKGLLGYIQKFRGYWFYITYLTIAANYFTWLGNEMGSIPDTANQGLLTLNIALFTLLSLPIVDIVASYLSSETVDKLVPKHILKRVDVHTGCKYVFYGLYGFLILTAQAYIWNWNIYFQKLGAFFAFVGTRLVTATIIIFFAFVLTRLLKQLIGGIIEARPAVDKKQRKNNRIYSFLAILKSVIPTLIWIPSTIIALILFGLDGKLVFYTFAGIIAVLMFVAQNVVQDIVKGSILILEDRIAIGDLVSISGVTGIVKKMTLDSLTIKDFDGVHHIMSYGNVETIANIAWKIAPINFHIKVKDLRKIDDAIKLLKKIGKDLSKDKELSKVIVEDMDVLGVERFDGNGISIGANIITTPAKMDIVKANLFRRILEEFQKSEIEVEFARS